MIRPFRRRHAGLTVLFAASQVAALAPCPEAESEPSLSVAMELREKGGSGDAVRVAKALLSLAKAGDLQSQYALARICERGEGLKAPDPARAVFWADRAAEGGCVDAMILMGLYWAAGFGVDRDIEAARRSFSKAVEVGDPLAAAFLLASGAEADVAVRLAPSCTLGDLAPFAELAARAGLLDRLFRAAMSSGGGGRDLSPLFRIGCGKASGNGS